jgi:hypothetical protein
MPARSRATTCPFPVYKKRSVEVVKVTEEMEFKAYDKLCV